MVKQMWARVFRDRGWRGFNPSSALLLNELRRCFNDCTSVLDLGCGPSSKLQYFDMRKVGVEGHEPSLLAARSRGTHDELIQINVQNIGESFLPDTFDVVVALDLIEHVTKEEGLRLLSDMERIARKRVIVFTPNGFMPQESADGDLQEHLSGWSTTDFSERGYQVYGMHGLERLRDGVRLRYRPRILWGMVSLLSQVFYTYRHPHAAGHLFAVREVT
jgi:SAM-dependent methyltransferase